MLVYGDLIATWIISSIYNDLAVHIVQGEPFIWGVTIKNIDNKPTPESKITFAQIKDLNDTFFHPMDDGEKFIHSLNPGDEIYMEIDKSTVFLEGMQWAEVTIEPNDECKYFETYQYDEKHNKVTKYYDNEEDKNEWIDSIYIQKKVELLQSRTNNYILLLTVITVWESLFGIKDTVKNLFSGLSFVLMEVGQGINWLQNFL